MILRAALKFKNIIFLAGGFLLAVSISSSFPDTAWLPYTVGAAGTAAYIAGVIRTVKSGEFREEIRLSQRLDGISELNDACNALYRRISGRLGKNQRIKVIGVLKQKDELMRYFERYSDDPIRQKIIEQALKLVAAYFNLTCNYCERARELSQQNLNELVSRINTNNRKLGSLKNYQAVLELTKTVEMDEKLLGELREDREQLEIVNVRLDQIESTIAGFKHRILSSDLSDPETEEIENAVNEATALDNALNEHRKYRQRL